MKETLTLLDELFSDEGLLKKSLPSYEARHGQQQMSKQIWEAFEEETSAIFEAGTGIGKSLAYLIPALLWSYRTGEKIVISTYTIALQEQLIEKDIPMLVKALGIELRVVLAKGMGNYLCLRKLEDVSKQHGLFDQSVEPLVGWAAKTTDGTKSAIPFSLSGDIWGQVFAESDACSYVKCPHYKQCFFFKARARVQDADVIIVNHHLLMANLLASENQSILPPFTRLIVDEAHHLEHVARSSLTQTLDRIQLFKTLARVHSENHPEVSRLMFLKEVLKQDKALAIRLSVDLPGERRDLTLKINTAFDLLDKLFLNAYKARLRPEMLKSIEEPFLEVKEGLKRYSDSLNSLKGYVPDELKQKVEVALDDIASTTEKLKVTIETIDAFFKSEGDGGVRWAEKTPEGIILSLAQLDVAPFLEEKLFNTLKSTILCSATMTIGENFEHVKTNLGLKEDVLEAVYHSPFDFKTRTRLLGFSDLPAPNAFNFIKEAAEVIREAIKISGGGAFVLFTSYDMLNKCAQELLDLPYLKQGDRPRHQLLEEFKNRKNGILFGTDSFWEGVDVAGEALRLVIIVKLPFPVPSEPLIEARAEYLKKQGRDPFNEDSVPQAVMKFKQGFGRLMRRKEDRGCILCLDERLFNRSYGKTFLKSLPECVTSFQPRKTIFEEMKRFYGA
ncbi:MAG: ATP-dependent DNA helicase [Verrucomicrobia bacterium]|nr:ATP-dependent DNA helicase [Verrucomicrobiota bacterium]